MYLQLFGLTVNLPAQIVGLIGLAVIAVSYQFRKVKYLVWSTVAMELFLAESCILSADSDTVTGIVINATAIARNLAMIAWAVKKKAELPPWLAAAFLAPMWAVCAFYFGAWYTYLPPVLQTVYTFCAVSRNDFVFRSGALVLESGNFFYNASVGAYIGVVRQIVLVTSVVVSIAAAARDGKREKAQAAALPDGAADAADKKM